MITVFTPTYNRGYVIRRLFDSLCRQSSNDFEWVIIDDGSTDNTRSIVQEFIPSAKFPIRYYKTRNGGKHRAVNLGVQMASGELFFIVDSDDYITPDAIEKLSIHYQEIEHDDSIAGVCGLRMYPYGKINGLVRKFEILDTTTSGISKYINGDMAEAIKISVLKEFPFPEIDGENFISEGIIWNRISNKYKIRYFFTPIYICEYLSDGLTKSIVKHHRKSPLGTLLVYKEQAMYATFLGRCLKAYLNYFRYRPMVQSIPKEYDVPIWSKIFAPIGYVLFIVDSLRL